MKLTLSNEFFDGKNYYYLAKSKDNIFSLKSNAKVKNNMKFVMVRQKVEIVGSSLIYECDYLSNNYDGIKLVTSKNNISKNIIIEHPQNGN